MSWFSKELDPKAYIIPSESGFTNDEITLLWLKHFIKNTKSTPETEWKLLLMDNHGSHMLSEFVKLANENKIRPFPFLPHLTHVMQPLDVGVFQPYKHWHDKHVQKAMTHLNVTYTIQDFLRDLSSIRAETFKKQTIRSAFKKCGLWPISEHKCLEQLRKFAPKKSKSKKDNPPPSQDNAGLPPIDLESPPTPETTEQILAATDRWEKRMDELLSSPSRIQYHNDCQSSNYRAYYLQKQTSFRLERQKPKDSTLYKAL